MAKEVKLRAGQEFNFKRPPINGGVSVYPWDEWFTGKLILLERSLFDQDGTITDVRDYDVPTNAMVPKIHTAARRRYKVVGVSRYDVNGERLKDALLIQSRNMSPDERNIEDLQRVEDKKKFKAQRVARKEKMTSQSEDTVQATD